MNTIRNSSFRQLVFGSFLAILWAAGLFGVLEADSLLAKGLLLLLMVPLSLGLDRLVTWLISDSRPVAVYPSPTLAPAYIKVEANNERLAA